MDAPDAFVVLNFEKNRTKFFRINVSYIQDKLIVLRPKQGIEFSKPPQGGGLSGKRRNDRR